MKKFTFLIPVAAAAAALSGQVEAKVAGGIPTIDTTKVTPAENGTTSGLTEKFYVKDGELHSLLMKPSTSGEILAAHRSHSSHSSHRSHYSHRSGS